ncbi:MAG: F0F1 ATP synthase subunit B [Armatimonadota bacterium]
MESLIDPAILPAQIIGFLLLWFVLAKFLFRPVLALLKSRDEEIKSTYDEAAAERARADQFRTEYETRLSGIEAEARTRLQDAVKEAQTAKDEIIGEARGRSEELLRRAQEDLAREREKTLAQLREQVVDISLGAAGKLIGESLDEAKHRRLVGEFIDRIEAK